MITKKIKQGMKAGVLALAMVTFFSCSDFLTQMPNTSKTEEEVFSDMDNLVPAVEGLYTSLKGTKNGRTGFTLLMAGLDETQQGIVQMMDVNQQGLDYYNGLLQSDNPRIAEMWGWRWKPINDAAKAIYGLDVAKASYAGDEETLALIRSMRGEACFIRGLLMFEFAMYWGEVPVVEVGVTENTARQPLEVVWGQIFADLTYASENLPEKQAADPKRATSGAALAMMGKAYMSAPIETKLRDFNKAKECFEAIRSRYSLATQYAECFSENLNFNSPESILELDYRPARDDKGDYSNHWQWDLGSRTVHDQLKEACYFGGFDVVLPTQYCYKMKADGGVWEEGDLRRNVAIRFDFTYEPLGMTFEIPSWGADELDPHIKKWEDKRCDALEGTSAATSRTFYLSGKHYMMLRYADVLLSLAECMNELGQTGEAVAIVNQVRARAWGGTLPSDKQWSAMSQDEFRTQIMDERMRELCFEGWRRIDLIRTGKFVELIKAHNSNAKQSGTIQPFHALYPVPKSEIDNNPDINPEDQNQGYN